MLIDTELPALDKPIPNDFNHLHFGAGQTEAEITLKPGTGPTPISWTVDVLGSGYSVCRQGVLLFLPFLLILLFGPCGAHPSVPARGFDPPSRAGAVKVAHFARPRGLDLDGPEHGGRME